MPQEIRKHDTQQHEISVYLPRFERFSREVLGPGQYASAQPLPVSAWLVEGSERHDAPLPSSADAAAQPYRPVEPGWAWGPKWATCWFRVVGELPPGDRDRLAIRFSSGTEATVWSNGAPVRGLDVNRDEVPIREALAPDGASIDLRVEASCNHPWGVVAFDWDHAEDHRRWTGPTPGRLEHCELVRIDDGVRALLRAYDFARLLLGELAPASPRAAQLYHALTLATELIDDADVSRTAGRAVEPLHAALAVEPDGAAPIVHAVGHAHIDTAWLWTIRETRRKVIRSWTNALRLLERNDAFTFACSQTQQYAWLKDDAPAVFEQISARVGEGRWEPFGGMWVEPDCSVPSGEALIRQVLHADRWWRSQFADRGAQRVLFLPDTFGFPATLPGIMRACGLDTFITNKLSWNQFNTMPDTDFVWRGIDGSEVLAHQTPGGDYNATLTPKELRKNTDNLRGAEHRRPVDAEAACAPAEVLQPFGFGDGGGGATERMLDDAHLARACAGVPRTELSSVGAFVERLHAQADRSPPPTWAGELYLELHRGTLTTHAWLKAMNRRAEEALRVAEMVAQHRPSAQHEADLDRAWKLLLLNQFHDILPGSSIGPVYTEARAQLDEAIDTAERITGTGDAVLNPASTPRGGVIETGDGSIVFVEPIRPLAAVRPVATTPSQPVVASDRSLENAHVRVELDVAGRIAALHDKRSGRNLASGALGELVLLEDRPMMWDAWDIDRYSEDKVVWRQDSPVEIERVTEHELRAELRCSFAVGEKSRVTRTVRLDADSPRVDLITEVDWHETHRLLRMLFPAAVRTERVGYDVGIGHIERPAHRNTAWDRARFEVSAHRWMSAHEHGAGLAILNTGTYGCGAAANAEACTMHVSLLRSPVHPDPGADRGTNRFVHSLLPHDGGLRAVTAEAEALNRPLRHVAGETPAPFVIETAGSAACEIAACKAAADDPSRRVVRVFEVAGGRGSCSVRSANPIRRAALADALERPIDGEDLAIDDNTIEFRVEPFSIRTVLIEPA
ncbi:MAG: glycoside hydrolase family 38 C-terminal domain-containing protein [Planctomycetota bacterium]